MKSGNHSKECNKALLQRAVLVRVLPHKTSPVAAFSQFTSNYVCQSSSLETRNIFPPNFGFHMIPVSVVLFFSSFLVGRRTNN